MAITITKEPQGTLLNAYNNSILEFTGSGVSARALVDVAGYVFEITPNQGVFYFNLREVITLLINQNAFSDDIEVTNPNIYIYQDNTLYLEQEVKITVIGSAGATETTTKTYKFLKSVEQLYKIDYDDSDSVKVLLPYIEGRKNATYFEGLPFDISIYSDSDRQVTIYNRNTTVSLQINLLKGVNRLFISNGENDDLGFEKFMPLYVGYNNLEIWIDNVDSENKILIPIKKVAVDCGVYLKWFNAQSGWSYWRFDKVYQESVNSKKMDELNSDFYNLEESRSPTISTGRETQKQLDLDTGRLDAYERVLVEGIYPSPKVYIYAQERLQPFTKFDWKEVDIKDGSQTTLNTKKKYHQFSIKVALPKQYSQTYAS